MSVFVSELSSTTTPEQCLETAAVNIRNPKLCTSQYSLRNETCGTEVKVICENLTMAWKGFVEQSHHHMLVASLPSNTSLYNLACVQSLACELYLKLYIEQEEVDISANFAEIIHNVGNELVAVDFVPVMIPPYTRGESVTVKDMINRRLDVAEKCLQIAVSAGYGRGEKTGSLALEHMRHKDADLLAVRALRGFDWLG